MAHPTDLADSGLTPSIADGGILMDLWRRRLDTMISGIANGDPYYQQIANAAEHISAEYQGRFLVELIQNANDQAVRAGALESAVTVTRTPSLIAVGNSGQPFDANRVDAITSIFKSDKTAGECIGNKGIGFKAVFQIADVAEIYSSCAGCSLADGAAIAFRITRCPLSEPGPMARMRDLATYLLSHNSDRRIAIEQRFPAATALDVVLREATRAAWFTFPLPLGSDDLAGRVEQLGLSHSVLAETQTLILLTVRASDDVAERVDEAIDDIRGLSRRGKRHPAGATFLFLPGISRMNIIDRARGFGVELRRTPLGDAEDLGEGISLRCQRTTTGEYDLGQHDIRPTSQDWWVVERQVGAEADGIDAAEERKVLRDAIQALHLPEENWKDVEQVPISVALPVPALAEDAPATPLGCDGHFCIGLPTQVQTGSPLWVSSHFHGKIDRTAIDFQSDYNDLLFRAAETLVVSLIERLKADSRIATRRLATLSMERGSGVLADSLYAPGGLAYRDVVLDETQSFTSGAGLSLPNAADLDLFLGIVQDIADLAPYGLRLPDRDLLTNARSVIDALAPQGQIADAVYLKRPTGQPSLLELAAKMHRTDGPAFWEKYLAWALDRFGSDLGSLESQSFLPVGRDELATPASRVFFPPVVASGGASEEGAKRSVDDAGDELATIDELVQPLLRLFDDSAIKVRTGIGRDYTPLAQRLAPATGTGLVRRPRQSDLINDALAPAMHKLKDDNVPVLALLRQALVWLVAMPAKSRQRVDTDELLVPTRGRGDAWEWVSPSLAYLGSGWRDGPEIELLTKAYGSRDAAQLPSWDRFEKRLLRLTNPGDRSWWCERLQEIGVWDSPRVIHAGERLEMAQSDSYSRLTEWGWVKCPVPCVHAMWSQYVEYACQRSAATKTGQRFYLHNVTWIDGLENNDIRHFVFEAMLRKPEVYERVTQDRLTRWDGTDGSEPLSLWAYVLKEADFPVVPTSHELRSPSESWFLPLDLRTTKGERFSFLPCVRAEFSSAKRLLATLGISSIEGATVPRLVGALTHLAGHVDGASPDDLRHIEAVAADVYEAIEGRLTTGDASDGLKLLADAPIPLLRANRIATVAIGTVDRIVVDDDPLRRQYLGGFDESWILPRRFGQVYTALAAGLKLLLGENRVIRVSECPIQVQFQPLEHGATVLDYLRSARPAQPLAEEIAMLLVKGGTAAASPSDPVFTDCWRRITHARIIRGTFERGGDLKACFDAQYSGGPAMMVDSGLDVHEIVAELWQVVNSSNRDTWIAFGDAIRQGTTDRFFSQRGASDAERTEVESVIGLGFEQRLKKYHPVCLAAWRALHPEGSIDAFLMEWSQHTKTVENAAAWLGRADLPQLIELASQKDEPDASVWLLGQLGISVAQWQAARGELGDDPYRFAQSERMHGVATAAITGHLAALFAYLVVPRASGAPGPTITPSLADRVSKWVLVIQQQAVPDTIAQQPLPSHAIISHVANDALKMLDDSDGLELLSEPLVALARGAPTDAASMKLRDEPDKAATIYEADELVTREQQAAAAVESLLKVAIPLSAKHGEKLDAKEVLEHKLVTLLCHGPWANRISVLAAVRFALETIICETAARMKDRQAFRDLDDWRVLWRKFEELGELPTAAVSPPAKPTFNVLGSQWTEEEFRTAAAAGEEGSVAQGIQKAVNPALDLRSLSTAVREKVQVRPPRRKGSGGNGNSGKRMPDAYLAMLGAIGEHFVYSQLRAALHDFDLTHWRSKMKEHFGYGSGDDSLGYDFEYTDGSGLLTGRTEHPRCLIEVKSLASQSRATFEMSTNEWEVARECHTGDRKAVYVIIRVENTASVPAIIDILIDPIALHLAGLLDYSSRNLLVEVGERR